MLIYEYTEGNPKADVRVAINNGVGNRHKICGTIKNEGNGWRYYPKGCKVGGDLFSSLKLCQKSLEG